MHTKIIGTGSYLPEQVRTNADLEKMVDTSDEWIVSRTGIRERRIAGPDESVSTLGYEAAKRALEMAGIDASELGLIVVATTSATHAFPSAACQIQDMLGVKGAPAFDIAAACAGFTYALSVADQYNGACLLGLRGTVIKRHGAANQRAFAIAIEQAVQAVQRQVPKRMAARLESVYPAGFNTPEASK